MSATPNLRTKLIGYRLDIDSSKDNTSRSISLMSADPAVSSNVRKPGHYHHGQRFHYHRSFEPMREHVWW